MSFPLLIVFEKSILMQKKNLDVFFSVFSFRIKFDIKFVFILLLNFLFYILLQNTKPKKKFR